MLALEHIGDGDHDVEQFARVALAQAGRAAEGVAQLQQIQFRQPGALFKAGPGVGGIQGWWRAGALGSPPEGLGVGVGHGERQWAP